jgi:hypothetical protein
MDVSGLPVQAKNELLSIMPAVIIDMLLSAWAAAEGQPAFVGNRYLR